MIIHKEQLAELSVTNEKVEPNTKSGKHKRLSMLPRNGDIRNVGIRADKNK
jgi:hypothetical protein